MMNGMGSRYVLGEQLGKGGMGVVYRAFDQLEGKPVALKRIEHDPLTLELNPLAADLRYQHMLLAHEFSMLASLRHPNIISVLDYGFTTERQPFFLMELLDQPRTIIEAPAKPDTKSKVDLLIQTLQAILYLHRHHILHRDLKPTNVLVNQNGQVKVLDFGLAVKEGRHREKVGTPYYMAPEVINHGSAVEASDLFAVGVMAYELFVGTRPFLGASQREILDRIVDTLPNMIPFENLAKGDPIFYRIAPIVWHLLEKQPEDRYSDALTVIRAFCQALDEPLPPDEGPIRDAFLQTATFVGRTREMETLQGAMAQAQQGHGSAWLIGGESGVGKSRMLDELRVLALTEGVIVLRGQFAENDGSLTQSWGTLLRSLLLSIAVENSQKRSLNGVLSDAVSALQSAARITDGLVPSVRQLFNQISQPTLMLIEDLQWAGAALEPLRALVPLVANLPILVIGSYRSDEAPHLHDQLSGVCLLRLEKLSYQDVAELCTSMLGNSPHTSEVLNRLYEETEGNAFFIVEVMRALAQEAGQLSLVGQVQLPESIFSGGIQQIVQRRLRSVPDWAYGGLQVAAVMGRTLDLNVLDILLSPLLRVIPSDNVAVSISTVWREERRLNLDDWLLVCVDAAILEVHAGS